MQRVYSGVLVFVLAAAIHVDWHLARPAHHGLSLEWAHHWLFAVAVFALVGWLIARGWPDGSGWVALKVIALAVLFGQGIEPVLERAIYHREFGYPADPERWRAFWVCLGAGLPALLTTLVLCRPRRGSPGPVTPAA